MMSLVFNAAIALFVFLVLLLILHPKIPTGALGSLGLLTMAVGAVLATDDSLYHSTDSVEATFMTLLGGALLCIGQFLIAMRRKKVFEGTGLTQFGEDTEARDGLHLGH